MNKKLLSFVLIFPLLLVSFSFGKVSAEAPEQKLQDIPVKVNYTREEVYELAILTAKEYGINIHNLLITIDQESNFEQYAKGDNSASLGACQIHSSNKIPADKRNDPKFCLDWTAKQFISGKARLWTGYRLCVLGEVITYNGEILKCTATGTL